MMKSLLKLFFKPETIAGYLADRIQAVANSTLVGKEEHAKRWALLAEETAENAREAAKMLKDAIVTDDERDAIAGQLTTQIARLWNLI